MLLLASFAGAQQQNRDLVLQNNVRKVALVIGNDSYPRAGLQNARNDARAISTALRDLGFAVTTLEDANRDQLVSAVSRFGESLRPTDVAWFFYAGHGLQVGGENYLIPVDFTGDSQTAVRLAGLPVTELQTAFSKAQISVVVLDACRNNPFLATRSGSGGSGLAQMEARGSLISFSTGAGQTASDNTKSGNGLFTQELLSVMREPGMSVRDMFFRVRQRVFEVSEGQQFPAVYDGLVGNLILRPAPPVTTVAEEAQKPTIPVQKPAAPPASPKPTAGAQAKSGGGSGKWILLGVGGAGAAGAAVALGGGGGGGQDPPSNTPTTNTPTTTTSTPTPLVKRGDYTGQGNISYTTSFSDGRVGSCVHARSMTGSLTTSLEQKPDGSITGTATTSTQLTITAATGCGAEASPVGSMFRYDWTLTASGTAQNLTFTAQQPFTATPTTGGTISGTRTLTFQGTVQAGVISGTLTLTETADGTALGSPLAWRGSATADVTLR